MCAFVSVVNMLAKRCSFNIINFGEQLQLKKKKTQKQYDFIFEV